MKLKSLLIASVACSLALPLPAPVRADSAIPELLIGGAIICGLTNCLRGNQRQTTTRSTTGTRRAPAPAPADEGLRQDQTALNHFGFPAGTPDGRMGRNTRNAISGYQAYMGYPVTGQLNDWERQMLRSAYGRSQAGGGYPYQDVVAAEGMQGLLKAFEAEGRGQRYCAFGQPCQPTLAGGQGTNPAPAPAPQPVPAPQPAPEQIADPALPPVGRAPIGTSMAAHCSRVGQVTRANGAPIQAGSVTDSAQALDEQFCGARDYAIARAQQLAAAMPGTTDAQLQTECQGLVGTMAGQVGQLGSGSAASVSASTAAFAAAFNAPAAQLMNIGEICLGIGYQGDNPDVALASAMLLVGAGAQPYAEVFGHHLRRGFGIAANPAAATDWYVSGLAALDGGLPPAFQPAQSAERAAVIRTALSSTTAQGTGIALPNFGAGN